jgi:hypothetical protein
MCSRTLSDRKAASSASSRERSSNVILLRLLSSDSFPALKLALFPRSLAATLAALPSFSEIPLNSIASLLSRRYPRGFTFYVARPRAPFLNS